MDKVILKVENVTKRYKNRTAVNNLSFEIYEGEIFGFLGPNGAGKTTTNKMITGLAKMDSGDIYICDKSIKNHYEKAISNVGAIIETPQMYSYMSGLDNLKYYASLYRNVSLEQINRIVELVGLKDRIKDKVSTYSLGMKQRLGIACAILHKPKLLILDEPTNGLDPEGVIEIRNFLKKLARKNKISILISSHNLAEMELICDTIGIINNGILENIKNIDQLKNYNNNNQIVLKVNFPNYAGKLIINKYQPDKISIIKNTLTVNLDESKIPEITVLLVSNGILIYSISSHNQTLEDVFLDTINRRALPAPKGDKND